MTSSVINAPVGQELQLSDLQNISGGNAVLLVGSGVIWGAGAAAVTDMLLEHHTGKGLGEHIGKAFEDAYDWATKSDDQCDVAPTGDGKGCTDRDLPM